VRRRRASEAAVVDVGSVVCRLRSRWRKPYLWAHEVHPHFVTDRRAELDVQFVYDEGYYRHPLPWVATDTVQDAPVVRTRGREIIVESSFYRARVRHGRVRVTIAAGFRVDAVLRALCALRLGRRRGLLVDGARLADGDDGALLIGGHDSPIADAGAFTGLVAAVRADEGYRLHVTPFDAPENARPDRGVRARAVYLLREDAPATPTRLATARALALAGPHLVIVDEKARALESAARLFAALPCFVTGRVPALAEWEGRDAA
jgi:hypothetical protein